MNILLLDDAMTSPTLANGSCDRTDRLRSDPATPPPMALEQHLNLLRTIIDTSEDCIFAKDSQFRYILVNQSFAKFLGRTVDSILGKTDPDLGLSHTDVFGDPERGTRGFRADDIDVLAGRSIHNPYDVVTQEDGSQIIFDTHKKPLKDTGGQIIGLVSMSKNVTERHRTAQALAESRNMLQQVLNTFPQHVFWKDKRSVFLGCNQRLAEFVGLNSPEDIVGKTDFDLPCSDAEATHYRARDRRIMDANIPEVGIEESLRQSDGRQSWLETNKIPLHDKTGQVIGILGSFQDITERKQAEIDLRNSQQKLKLLIDQTPLAVIEWDPQGHIRHWNQAAQRTFGYRKAEAIGQHLRIVIPIHYQAQVNQICQALLTQTGGQKSINENITKSGRTIICEWHNTPLVDGQGQVIGVISMALDVTERQQNEARTMAQNQLTAFRAAVDAALIRTKTLKGALQHCTEAVVQQLEAASARIWTLSTDGKMLELQASAGLHPPVEGGYAQVPLGQFKMGLIAAERQPHITNNLPQDPRVNHRDWLKREGLVAFAGYPILLGEELLGVITMFSRQPIAQSVLDYLESAATEISLGIKRYKTESALRASESSLRQRTHELEQLMTDLQQTQLQMIQNEKMSALGNLVAGVAHEINNPIGFLKGNIKPAHGYVTDLLSLIDRYQAAMPNPPQEIEDELEAIDFDFIKADLPKLLNSMTIGVDRIKGISTSLRTFSRADQDHKTRFNLHEGLDSTLLILKHRLKANDTRPEIIVRRQYGTLPKIDCFAGQLNQVFMNLLANAIDALEEDNGNRDLDEIKAQPNQIVIQTREVQAGRSVEVLIQDNGTGMPETVKDRIFDHLFTTKAVGQGTGLGLAIAHQIVVDNHGGRIAVTSEPGEGTTFTLTLPIHASECCNCDGAPMP